MRGKKADLKTGMDLEWIDIVKLLGAALAGALIGIERELSAKPAGLRTNVMICIGAALFTVLSQKMAAGGQFSDPARIAAQVVTGVGFLGAGAIIHLRRSVLGLTTAATIWIVASIGMAFGAGEFGLGIVGAILTSAMLFGLGLAEGRIARWRTVGRFEVEVNPAVDAKKLIRRIGRHAGVRMKVWSVTKTPDAGIAWFKAQGSASTLRELERALLHDESIRTLKRL